MISLLSVVLSVFFTNPAHASANSLSITNLYSSIEMRGIQAKLDDLCKLTKSECFVKTAMIDQLPTDKTLVDLAKISADHLLIFSKYHLEESSLKKAFSAVLQKGKFESNLKRASLVDSFLAETSSLSKEKLGVVGGDVYSGLINEKVMVIILKNPKFQSAEIIFFGAGESADTF